MKTSPKHVSRRRFLGLTSLMTLTTLSTGKQALAGSSTRPFKIRVTSDSWSDTAVSQLSEQFDELTRGILLKRRYPEATYDLQPDRTLLLRVQEPQSGRALDRQVVRDLSFGMEEVHHLYAEALRSVVRLAPDEPYPVRALGDYYLSFRRYKEGIADFQELTTDQPDQPLPLFQLGMIYDRSNQKQAAYDVFQKVHQLAPKDAITLYNLGAIAADLSRYEDAEQWFTAALKQDPKMHTAKKQLELLQQRMNQKTFTLRNGINK